MLLLDSLQKRCKFVEQVIQHLHIQNVSVLWSRAETAGRDPKTREVQNPHEAMQLNQTLKWQHSFLHAVL